MGSLNIVVIVNLMMIVSVSGETCQIFFVNFCRLRLGFNQIKSVENGSFVSIPNVREIHLDNNRLRKVPPGLNSLRYLQVRCRHRNESGTAICIKVPVTKRICDGHFDRQVSLSKLFFFFNKYLFLQVLKMRR